MTETNPLASSGTIVPRRKEYDTLAIWPAHLYKNGKEFAPSAPSPPKTAEETIIDHYSRRPSP